jgi:phosphinothricin acetyltransferase
MARVTVRRRPTVTLLVRPGEPNDLGAVLEIYNHYVVHTAATFEVTAVRLEDRRSWLAEHSVAGPHRLLVAEDPTGSILGWATTSPFRPRAAYSTTVESSVYLRPGALRRGVGTQLYDELFRSIEGQDLERAVAGIALPNPASVALHRRFGFRHVGTFTRVGRKFGRYWDVAWYERPMRTADDRSAPGVAGQIYEDRAGHDPPAGRLLGKDP